MFGNLLLAFLMRAFVMYLITAGLHPKCNLIMAHNRSRDIKLYLGHGKLDKHLLIMAFIGLRSDLSGDVEDALWLPRPNEFAAHWRDAHQSC